MWRTEEGQRRRGRGIKTTLEGEVDMIGEGRSQDLNMDPRRVGCVEMKITRSETVHIEAVRITTSRQHQQILP